MELAAFLEHALIFTGRVSPGLVAALFLITAIGEFGVSVPYLLETFWLLTGYHAGSGSLHYSELALLWLCAESGRQAGAIGLYYASRLGGSPLMKLYYRFFHRELSDKASDNSFLPFKLFRRINPLSPYSVAIGRLVWLRIPLTIALGIKRRLGVLVVAVLLSSLAWDMPYILVGLVGGNRVTPFWMVAYSLAGLSLLYLGRFLFKHRPRVALSPEAGKSGK